MKYRVFDINTIDAIIDRVLIENKIIFKTFRRMCIVLRIDDLQVNREFIKSIMGNPNVDIHKASTEFEDVPGCRVYEFNYDHKKGPLGIILVRNDCNERESYINIYGNPIKLEDNCIRVLVQYDEVYDF